MDMEFDFDDLDLGEQPSDGGGNGRGRGAKAKAKGKSQRQGQVDKSCFLPACPDKKKAHSKFCARHEKKPLLLSSSKLIGIMSWSRMNKSCKIQPRRLWPLKTLSVRTWESGKRS